LHPLLDSIEKVDINVADVVLREFSRQALKPDERPDRLWPQDADQRV